jgi:transcriptional regulator with XRE-family HTH domain
MRGRIITGPDSQDKQYVAKHFKIMKYTLGGRIKFLRKSRNWSESDLAEKLNIALTAYTKIESGEEGLTFSKMKQITEVFGISMRSFKVKEPDSLAGITATVKDLKEKIADKELELRKLQRLAISLYEELKRQRR